MLRCFRCQHQLRAVPTLRFAQRYLPRGFGIAFLLPKNIGRPRCRQRRAAQVHIIKFRLPKLRVDAARRLAQAVGQRIILFARGV